MVSHTVGLGPLGSMVSWNGAPTPQLLQVGRSNMELPFEPHHKTIVRFLQKPSLPAVVNDLVGNFVVAAAAGGTALPVEPAIKQGPHHQSCLT